MLVTVQGGTKSGNLRDMDEKQLLKILGIGAEDWVRPTDRQRQTASSGVRFEDRTARAASQRITIISRAAFRESQS